METHSCGEMTAYQQKSVQILPYSSKPLPGQERRLACAGRMHCMKWGRQMQPGEM